MDHQFQIEYEKLEECTHRDLNLRHYNIESLYKREPFYFPKYSSVGDGYEPFFHQELIVFFELWKNDFVFEMMNPFFIQSTYFFHNISTILLYLTHSWAFYFSCIQYSSFSSQDFQLNHNKEARNFPDFEKFDYFLAVSKQSLLILFYL